MPLTADAKRSVHIASNPVMATFPRAAHRVSTTPRSSGNLPATQSPGSLSDTAQQPPPLPSATHVKPTTSVPISRGHLNHSLGGPGQYSHSGSVTSKSSSVGGLGAERTVRPILSQSAAFAQHHPGNPGDILHQSSILSSTSNVGSNVGSNGGGNARFANKADNSLLILSSSVGGDGLTQNRGAGKARFLAQRAQLHPILLSFSHAETEADYKIFFIEKHLFVWRRTVYLLFFAATALYAYVMIRSPADGREWGRLYTDEKKAGVTEDNISQYCPPGWFCMKCNPDYICNSYSVAADLAFWLATILAPCLALICVSYKVKGQFLASHIHLLSALFILAFAAGGVILRYLIVEPMTPVFQPALICIMLIFVSYMFMRLRFIYAVVSITIIVVWFIAGYAPHVTNHPELTPSTAKTYIISVLALVVSGGVMSFNTYENEVFNRSQFLAAYTLHKTNAKLLNQLKVLQKAYGRKVADLDSPLEKSVMLIRSLMADPSNSPSHLVTMGQIMTLLASSNLMTPDLENQVGDLVDTEQEVCLSGQLL
ncbi:hypothetical protein DFJ77DRAFT_211597 [Powellomyces hirtus]|nr:hypothetical protein DFJ77DRAFT_211597 [Powellomyces hirtus]